MADGLFDAKEAAAYFKISVDALYDLTAARAVPHTRIGKHIRFTQEHLDAVVAAGEQPVVTAPTRTQVAARRPRRSGRPA